MNTVGKLVDAWYSLLNGISVSVFRVDVPEDHIGNYVIIRPESGTGVNDKRSFNDNVIIITDVVTIFENNANQRIAEAIDVEIFDRVLSSPSLNGFTDPSGMQILNVNRESFTYLQERDQVNTYYRKVSRYNHRIHQTT